MLAAHMPTRVMVKARVAIYKDNVIFSWEMALDSIQRQLWRHTSWRKTPKRGWTF